MSQAVRVPDPVYERISKKAKEHDVSRGTVVQIWMEKAEQFERVQEDYR